MERIIIGPGVDSMDIFEDDDENHVHPYPVPWKSAITHSSGELAILSGETHYDFVRRARRTRVRALSALAAATALGLALYGLARVRRALR